MNGGVRDDKIREVTEACRDYWRRNGVPEARTVEMSAELLDHLGEALADGKTIKDVIGPDVEAFAEEWASPNRPTRSLGEETLDVISDATFALAVVGVLAHLALWSPSLPFDAGWATGSLLLALLFARLFAYLRAPSDEPPGSEESVLDRYPRRLYDGFVWVLIAVWTVHLFLPLPDTVLFRWPVQATLALPLVAVLIRGTKRFVGGGAERGGRIRMADEVQHQEDRRTQAMDTVMDCSLHWGKMRLPGDRIDDMRRDLDAYIERALQEGRTVRSVVGDNIEEFAGAWAEGYDVEPDFSPEPLRHVVQGWVLSFSACVTILATLYHVLEWSLYAPVAWVLGVYLFLVAAWFGQPVADLFDRAKAWRYSAVKSMLAAGGLVLILAAVSAAMALLFTVVGPRIPFEWPWYATVASAFVAFSVVISWVRDFSREDAERERRRAGREYGRSEGA